MKIQNELQRRAFCAPMTHVPRDTGLAPGEVFDREQNGITVGLTVNK